MHVRYRMTALAAATAGGLAVAGLTGAAPALAEPIQAVNVPCSRGAVQRDQRRGGARCAVVGGELHLLADERTAGAWTSHHHPGLNTTIERSSPAAPRTSASYPGRRREPDHRRGELQQRRRHPPTAAPLRRGRPGDGQRRHLQGNNSGEYGGAIYSDDGLSVTRRHLHRQLRRSSTAGPSRTRLPRRSRLHVHHNTAEDGGAIDDDRDTTVESRPSSGTVPPPTAAPSRSTGSLAVHNVSFYQNSSPYGGAIEVEAGDLTVSTGYFQQNTARDGGGIATTMPA